MVKTLNRIAAMILVSGLTIGASKEAQAQHAWVRLQFSGTGSQPGIPGSQNFDGCIQYDTSLRDTSPYYFQFPDDNTYDHEVCYQTQAGWNGSAYNAATKPYTILTFANGAATLFQLQSAASMNNGPYTNVTMSVIIPAATGTTFPPNFPPKCVTSTGSAQFPTIPSAIPNSFKLTNPSGTVIFTGVISHVTCTPLTSLSTVSCPAITMAAEPAVLVSYYPVTESCPQYACPPRRSCCLTGLFARLCHGGRRCW
jgi:hypothetical protein